jgi:hypothetical protein
MKLDKRVVERRVQLMRDEGVKFVTNANIGVTHDAQEIRNGVDAMVLACGATVARDLPINGLYPSPLISFSFEAICCPWYTLAFCIVCNKYAMWCEYVLCLVARVNFLPSILSLQFSFTFLFLPLT